MLNISSARRLLLVAAMLAGAVAAGASRLYAEKVATKLQDPTCIADGCSGGPTNCEILANGKTCLKSIT